ncbi:hypothetical protein INR75_11550 [Zunongwangia sp. SCSIO 43204]|uniref:helix-turn-helix domain-containing protein n=1 Tax=Zunongwangia sp. SCSIO 43204 TaxID=2779359 RepID=UPI001CA9D483|nr:helix-turn-helix domain-containing protein [Zunongwangia sp. SCSIO 43204]UAB82865.1 hypothetical protein INR75_11550 [Zunongwangia sp. SCSIO 43204]
MNVLKNHITGNFTMVPNDLIEDNTLSDRSRFLYIFLVHKPENWEFRTKHLSDALGMHKDTFRKYRNELCARGWIEVEEQKIIKGEFKSKIYHLYGEPIHTNKQIPNDTKLEKGRNFPSRKKTVTEKNGHGKNPPLNNKNSIIISKKEKINRDKIEKTKNSNYQNPNPR